MEAFKKNLFLYIAIVLVPVITGGIYFYHFLVKEDFNNRKAHAEWVASIHQKSWNKFIGQTVTSLKIVSLSAEMNIKNPEKLEPLLRQVQQKDPRYGGLYLLDKRGIELIGSNPLIEENHFSKLAYIQETIKAKDTIISDKGEILANHQRIIGLAVPVMDSDRKLTGILVAHLRIDYFKNLMKIITPNENLLIVNGHLSPILKINLKGTSDLNKNNSVSTPINQLPWSIKVQLPKRNEKEIGKKLSLDLFYLLIISHIFYLLIQYMLLKRKAKRERLQYEAQKLELVGTFAASTAHEIRNPLTGIKGLIQLLSEKYKEPEDKYYFEVIETELQRINEIASEFLILGKPTAEKTEKVNIADIIKELKPLIISEGNIYNVQCYWEITTNAVQVRGIKDHIKQVILNLAKNAFESMNGGGNLTIRLYIDENKCKIEIIDTGIGISKKELEKIFHPFYTSKNTGTGLGLVICKRIIQSMGGSIDIKSQTSIGTTVNISLPLSK